MIPLGTVVPTRTFPAATVGLVLLHAGLFLYAAAVGAPPIDAGADDRTYRLGRAMAALLVHEDWLRLFANMTCLCLFGASLEDRMGTGRFAAFYAGCSVSAALVMLATMTAPTPAMGAAAPVAAVIGAHLALFPHSRVLLWLPLPKDRSLVEAPSLAVVALWAATQLAGGLVPSVTGGLAEPLAGPSALAAVIAATLGALLTRAFTRPERMRPEWWHDRR